MRDELMAHAPFLSQDAIREAALTDVMPHAMLLEVCLANPEGTHGDEFIWFLGNEIPSPMPSYMLDMIRNNWDQETPRTLLEHSLSQYENEMAFASNLLLTDLMLDSSEYNIDSIRYWFNRRGSLVDHYALIESYISEGNYTTAANLLNNLANLYELSEFENEEYNDYIDFFNFKSGLNSSGKTYIELDSSEIDILTSMAQNNVGRSASMAQNILCFFYDICPERDDELPDLESSKKEYRSTPISKYVQKSKVTIYPNPAESYTTIQWLLTTDRAVLSIKDISGRSIVELPIQVKEGSWLWDTRKVPNGIYLYEIRTTTGKLASGNIAIQH